MILNALSGKSIRLEIKDLVMLGLFDGIELLIFFLWGVNLVED